VAAGNQIGFKLDDNKMIYHPGPVAIYLGKAPKKVTDWDGSGKRWFKVFTVTSVCEAKVAKGLRAYPRSWNGDQCSDRLFSLASERAHLRQRYQSTFLLERQVFRYFDPEAHDGSVSSFSISSEQSRLPCTSRDILNSRIRLRQKKVWVSFLTIIKRDTNK
jgi:hypothetical protein